MKLRALVVSFVMLLVMTLDVWGQELSFLPGAKWGLVPPQGFRMYLEPLARFQHPSGAVIVVQEGPKPLTSDYLGAPGSIQGSGRDETRFDEQEEVEIGNQRAFLVKMRMIRRNADVAALLIEGSDSVGMISVAIPDAARGSVDMAGVRAALMTTRERGMESEDLLAQFPVKLADLAGMRVAAVLMGSIMVLTDGPGDDMEQSPDQSFAMIFPYRDGRGDSLELGRDLPAMTSLIKKQFPDAEILSSSERQTKNGPVLEVVYRRTHLSGKTLSGLMWARMIDKIMLLILVQYPQGQEGSMERFIRIRDGAAMR